MKTSKLNRAIATARNEKCAPELPNGEAKPRKTPGRAYVVATEFQRNVFECAFSGQHAVSKAIESGRARMLRIVGAQYGETCPTYEQFKSDRSAFTALALERGLVDDQVIRKPYCAAIVQLFGKLPVSDSPAAVAKRLQRPVHVKTPKVDTPPAERVETIPATIGQFIAKFGAGPVLVELAKILATEKTTAIDAKTLIAVASHLKAA